MISLAVRDLIQNTVDLLMLSHLCLFYKHLANGISQHEADFKQKNLHRIFVGFQQFSPYSITIVTDQ